MKILQISTADEGGGAERVAWNLLQYYRRHGHDSWMAVGFKRTQDPSTFEIPRGNSWVSRLRRLPDYLRGLESFRFPGTSQLLRIVPGSPDIIHCHNLHGNFFDLRALSGLSRQFPVLLNLHDAWLTTGHCAHSLGCDRWRTGCGHCPDLTIYPQLFRDGTASNWQRKLEIFRNSQVWLTAPSHWLMDRVRKSMLADAAIDMRVIPNGIDLDIFHARDRGGARREMQLPVDAAVLLFSAIRTRHDAWRDHSTIQDALRKVVAGSANGSRIICLALGEQMAAERFGNIEVRHLPKTRDIHRLATIYRAADIYLYASLADTFPTTVIEAQASGTPVIATAAGGIPEQVVDGVTGVLAPLQNSDAMAAAIVKLLADRDRLLQMGLDAEQHARRFFGLPDQAQAYLNWYDEIIAHFRAEGLNATASN